MCPSGSVQQPVSLAVTPGLTQRFLPSYQLPPGNRERRAERSQCESPKGALELLAPVWVRATTSECHCSGTAVLSTRVWGLLPETPLSQHFGLLCFVLCFGFGGYFVFLCFVLIFYLCLWRHIQEILIRQKNPSS